jgi:hypothetical protein
LFGRIVPSDTTTESRFALRRDVKLRHPDLEPLDRSDVEKLRHFGNCALLVARFYRAEVRAVLPWKLTRRRTITFSEYNNSFATVPANLSQ